MKIAGIFADLTVDPKEGIDVQAHSQIRSMQERGVNWSIALFAQSEGVFSDSTPANFRVIPSSRRFPILAFKAVRDTAVWLLCRRRIGVLRQIDAFIRSAGPDILYLEGIPLAPFVIAFGGIPIVFSCIDAMSLRHWRLMLQAKSIISFLRHANSAFISAIFEIFFLRHCSAVHVVSEIDAAHLRRLCPRANVCVIPIRSPADQRDDVPFTARNRERLIIWGDVGVPHLRSGLIKFLKSVPQLLGAYVPELLVLGRRAPDQNLRRASSHYPAVTFLEWISDIDALLRGAGAVLLLDESGTGIKNRAVHAMALGTVVIGTKSALEGIPVTNRRNVFICENPEEFAAAIQSVAAISDEVRDIEREALLFAKKNYSDDAISQRWKSLFRDIIQRSYH